MLYVSLVQFIGLNYAMRISLGLGLFLASRQFVNVTLASSMTAQLRVSYVATLLTNSYTFTKSTIGAAIFCFRS